MLRLMLYLLIMLFVLGACSAEEDNQRRRNNLEYSMPKGAKVIEHVPTASNWDGYVIFKFRGECFMLYRLMHQRSITRITCK